MAGWKLSTFLFAGTTLLLLGRDLLRAEAPAARAPARPDPVGAAPPPEAPAPTAAEHAEAPPPPPPSGLPAAAGDLAVEVLVNRRMSIEEALLLLEPRRAEVVAVLEDWIARADEIDAAGVELARVIEAYARLAGAAAVPALERLAGEAERPQTRKEAVRALTWIEDPEATRAILGLQERLPPGTELISYYELLGQTQAALEVLHAWEAVPAWRPGIRRALFQRGPLADRARIWASADREERRELFGTLGPGWSPQWDRILVDTAAAFLDSADPRERMLAFAAILRRPDNFPPGCVAAAERGLQADLRYAAPGEQRILTQTWESWQMRHEEQEKQERVREILLR